MGATEAEQAAMHRALALAETVRGRTSPNPAVGAVILDVAANLAGEGATSPPGGPHAEIVALRHAGKAARGGTVVVTLEPCAHTGRTGPCVKALVEAGVHRVVYAVDDPNPEAGGGADELRDAGVEVVDGVEAHAAAGGALRPWLHAMRTGRPYVTWKFAATLDGRSAATDGTSQWITSEEARADVHALRASRDAIVVGTGTILLDDPRLTVRTGAGRMPLGSLADRQPTRVVVGLRDVPARARVHEGPGEVLHIRSRDPHEALATMWDAGIRDVWLEGGPTLASAFVKAGLVDEVYAYLAPALLGAGRPAVGDLGITSMDGIRRLDVEDVLRVGPDLRVHATVAGPVGPPRGTGPVHRSNRRVLVSLDERV
jgi:diaminohydroxyphosphoribosylaminopyrimidine deaminase/5-amino-6-(5-phosphoribosylamino)uracil reductase